MLDNQLSQQNWNSGQIFNPPDQQLSSNQNFHQYNDQHNSLGQPNWNTNQFDQQQNWNNNQFSGGPQDQYQQQAWAPNQYGNGNFNNSQPDFLNQQYPNNNNTYQTDQQNMSFGQDMWTNNQMNQNNQAAWNNNQQNNSYAGKIVKFECLTSDHFYILIIQGTHLEINTQVSTLINVKKKLNKLKYSSR